MRLGHGPGSEAARNNRKDDRVQDQEIRNKGKGGAMDREQSSAGFVIGSEKVQAVEIKK